MPISGLILGQQIRTQMALNGMPGKVPYTAKFTNALGVGIANALLSATYTGVSTGLGLGTGVSTGAIVGPAIIPASLATLILAEMLVPQVGLPPEHNNMPGSPHTALFVNALATAVSGHIATVIITGTSTVVASGTGTGTVVGITGPSLSALIQSQLVSAGMGGASGYPKISTVIGNAVASAISSSIVNTTIVGVPVGPTPPSFTPIPSVGVDTGILT